MAGLGNEISVVLNVYKRPHMLERQIDAILNQSVGIDPNNIHVWYNKSDVDQQLPKDSRIKTYVCNWNTKFFGRFTVPLLIRTPYIAMFDDDNLPNENWFMSCLEVINRPETNGILGGTGVIVTRKGYIPYNKVGWNGVHVGDTRRVDLVGQTWFFRQEWVKYLWYEKPHSWDNGEDIMFSFLAQKHGNINTFVPPHPEENRSIWSTDLGTAQNVGSDQNASWRIGNHLQLRNRVVEYCIDNGWKTVLNIQK